MKLCNNYISDDYHNSFKMMLLSQVEFIIRRVPHGKVFALKRETEGQPLGLIREGNTAEIKEVCWSQTEPVYV